MNALLAILYCCAFIAVAGLALTSVKFAIESAQAIEAGTDETRSGSMQSTKARSRKGCAPKGAA